MPERTSCLCPELCCGAVMALFRKRGRLSPGADMWARGAPHHLAGLSVRANPCVIAAMRGFLLAVMCAAAVAVAAMPADARPLGELDVPNANVCPKGVRCGTLWRPLDPKGVVPGKVGVRWWLYRHTGHVK